MKRKFVCPRCRHEEVEVTTTVKDVVTYSATLYEGKPGEVWVEEKQFLKDYCGESEMEPEVECMRCHHKFLPKDAIPLEEEETKQNA